MNLMIFPTLLAIFPIVYRNIVTNTLLHAVGNFKHYINDCIKECKPTFNALLPGLQWFCAFILVISRTVLFSFLRCIYILVMSFSGWENRRKKKDDSHTAGLQNPNYLMRQSNSIPSKPALHQQDEELNGTEWM